jgi:superfamily II DNA or RNA helicase
MSTTVGERSMTMFEKSETIKGATYQMAKRDDTKLRNYQQKLIDETVEELREHRSVLLQAPTGAGKTEMAIEVARRHRNKVVWFVCHRHEIVTQTSAALKRSGADSHGVVAPRHPEDPAIRIQVCSIDALRHRFKRYPPPDLIVLDECHHAAAPSWAKLIKRFPDAKLLGLTATPERLDGRGLGDWFETMIIGPDTRTLIDEGYLSKFKYFAPTIPDLRGVRVKQKEYDRHDLEAAMNKSTLVGDVVDHFKERLTPNARALAFCVSVDASRELAARFKAAGVPAKHVDWKTSQEKREQAVADLASGKIRVLTNREVFTEGFDLPAIDAVLLLRPTKSFALYRQMIGRSLRTAKEKKHTTILDHAGLIYDHEFPDDDVEWSLTGRRSGVAITHKGSLHGIIRRCPECSDVHKWSAKCPECGYIYQIKDRTIEEVYGDLREITQGAKYESQARFARRCKLSRPTISNYVKQTKLIAYGPRRLIKIKEGLARVEWLRGNEGKYETKRAFAKRVGTTPQVIQRRGGLPKAKNGWVCIDTGLEWLKREGLLDKDGMYINQNLRSTPGFDSQTSFAKRLGVHQPTVTELIDEGLPINDRRLIPVEDGLQWLRRKGLLDKDGMYINQRPRSTPEFDSRTSFAKRLGVANKTVANLIKRGMPINELRLIPIEDGLEWLKREGLLDKDGMYTHRLQPTPEFDNQTSFAHRIATEPSTVANLIKRGLPINDRRLIPIEDGLQWLRHKGLLSKDGKYIRKKHHAFTDEEIKQAMVMRRQGHDWETIGEHLGMNGQSMFRVIKRRGIKLPDNDALEERQG